MSIKKIAIDYGHCLSGSDTGAQGCGRKEQDCTREIGKAVTSKLRAMGYTVIETAVDSASSVNASLSARVSAANNANADVFCSIHLNAFNGTANGICTMVSPNASSASREYARNIQNQFVALGYYLDRGVVTSNLYVCRNTNMPAVLCECGFIDSKKDMDNYSIEKLANAIVTGLVGKTITSATDSPINDKPANTTSKDMITIAKSYVGTRCKELQEKLIACGYGCGGYGADGEFGPATYNSLIQFQKDKGLVADGLAGPATFAKLDKILANRPVVDKWVLSLQKELNKQGFGPISEDGIAGGETLKACPLVKQGASGNITKLIQEKLNSLKFSCGAADGIFGGATKTAVAKFQSNKGLSADGIVGTNTWKKLLGL